MGAISTVFKVNASGAQSTLRSVTTHLTNIDKLVTKISAKPLTINSEGAERLVGLMTSHLGVMQSVTQNMTTLSATMSENMAKQAGAAQRIATAEAKAVQQAQTKAAAVERVVASEEATVVATTAEVAATAKTVSARQRILALVNSQRGSLTRVLGTERKITAEVDKQKDKGMSITRGLIRAWATLSGIRGLWMATNKLLNIFNISMLMTNKAATALRNSIGTMGSTGLDAGRVALDKYYEAANRARTSYTEFASTASKFMIVAPSVFGSDTKAIRFTETLSKSLQLAGATGEEVNSVLLQISQGLSSGYLQGDELRALRENGGMAAIALADYLGTTVGGLKELGAQGKITADVLVAALAAAEKDIDASFNKLPKTISQQMAIAGNYIRKTLEPLARRIQEWLNSDQFEKFAKASRKAWAIITTGLHAIVELALRVVIPAFNKIVDTLYWVATSSSAPATLIRLALLGIATAATLVGSRFIWMKVQAIAGTLAAMWPLILLGMVIVGLFNILGRLTGRFTTFGDTASNTIYAVIYAIVALGLTVFNTVITIVAVILNIVRAIIQIVSAVVSTVLALVIGIIMSIAQGVVTLVSWIIEGVGDALDAIHAFGNSLGESITAGVNKAILAVNWLIEKLNSIPGLDLNWNTLDKITYTPNEEGSSFSGSFHDAGDRVSALADKIGGSRDSILGGIEDFNIGLRSSDGPLGFVDSFTDWVTEHNNNNRPLDKADEIASGFTNKVKDWMSGIGEASNEEFLFDPYTGKADSDAGGAGGSGATGKIAQDTNDIKNLLERMRDLAERSAIAKFTNVNVNLDMTNNVGETDLDGVISYVNDKVSGAMNNSLAGVL